jgi:hypothetical protein
MREQSTRLTKVFEDRAHSALDLSDATKFLKEEFAVRSVREIIEDEITKKARESEASYEAVLKDMQIALGKSLVKWLEAKSLPRDSVIKLAYALQMTPYDADLLLNRFMWDGFYMRSAKDMIYWHGLDRRWTYQETKGMADAFDNLDTPNPNPESDDIEKNKNLTKYLLDKYEDSATTKEQLEDFIKDNSQYFGTFKRKAHKRFTELCDEIRKWENFLLQEDTCSSDKEAYARNTISLTDLCEIIAMGIPHLRKAEGNHSMLSKIYAKVPSTHTTISQILNKTGKGDAIEEVDRKLLMLAWFLGSEDGILAPFEKGEEEAKFHEYIHKINYGLLQPYGMPMLDPRHPFDWIVMNSLRVAYLSEADKDGDIDDVVDRMRKLIEALRVWEE